MNRVFEPRGFITVPDGTEVSAFLNATDASQPDVPWGVLGDMSIASGRIGPGSQSAVHIHPTAAVVTYLLCGELVLRMKAHLPQAQPYDVTLQPGQAALTEPGTFLQLRNLGAVRADVLYIVSPSYVFEVDDRVVPRHDDAVVVAGSWEELEAGHLIADALDFTPTEFARRRAEAVRRLADAKGQP